MNKLSIYQKPVTFRGVIAFTVPTILMTLIQSSYSMIDGIFITNLLGELALSSLTLISPYFNFFIAVAAMFASGGSAVVMKKMGEKKGDEARQDFTMLMTANLIVGALLMAVTMLFTGPLVSIFKASPEVTEYCREYLWAFGFFIIPQLLFSNLQIYTIASGKTKRAMFSAVFGGVFNIVFDYLLIGVFKGGMAGAAIASGFGMLIPCLILGAPLFQKKSMLHFTAPKFRLPVLIKTITNGFSEFSSNLVSGIVMLLFNGRMLRLAGENGFAAILLLPFILGINGLWLSVPVSEVLALFLSGYYIKKNQRKYGY